MDEAGRKRILKMCEAIREKCKQLSRPERAQKLQESLAKSAAGVEPCADTPQPEIPPVNTDTVPLLEVPRGRVPLSLWNWQIWSMARPTLWIWGDAGNLYPQRDPPLLTDEWIACMNLREELEYDVPGDETPFCA